MTYKTWNRIGNNEFISLGFALLVSLLIVPSCFGQTQQAPGANKSAPSGVIAPPDELHASHPIGICGTRHFEPRIEFCDTRNNHLYRYVTIAGLSWMAENLDLGTMITGDADQTQAGQKYCLDDAESDCSALYQWAEAMGLDPSFNGKVANLKGKVQGICPAGWRIPSSAEWHALLTLVDNEQGRDHESVSLMGYSSKDDFRWKTNTEPDAMLQTKDKYGFTILPTGHRVLKGTCPDGSPSDSYFCNEHDMAKFWSPEEAGSDAKTAVSMVFIEDFPQVIDSSKSLDEFLTPAQAKQWVSLAQRKAEGGSALQRSFKPSQKYQGMSVRCVKD